MKENSDVTNSNIRKRRIIVTHSVSGIDRSKEAADVVLKNSR